MDFLLQFRLKGPPHPPKVPRPPETEDLLQENIYVWLVLLSVKTPWKCLQYFCIIVRYTFTTYTVSFLGPHEERFYWFVTAVFDIIFLSDFISAVLLWVCWHKNQGSLSESSTSLSRLLWKSKDYKPRPIYQLIIDFISLIPLEFFLLWSTLPSEFHALLHMLPLLRIYRIIFLFAESGLEFSLVANILRILLKFFVIAQVSTHTITCIWYSMQDADSQTSLFAATETIKFDTNQPSHWYLVAFYFVQTTFTNIGFGDISPKTDSERFFVIFISTAGFVLINGYLIGALSSVVSEQARRLTYLRLRLSLIQTELEKRKVPVDINKKIMRFYFALWLTRKGAGATNKTLDELPPGISIQVYFDIFSPALKASLLFRSCEEDSLRAISRVMTLNLYMAGDVILRRSEMNSNMFFIRKGTIQIMSYQDDETEIMTFGAGTVFGQCSLLLSLPAKSEVHAATFCEIHTLNRRNLFYTLIDYPAAKEIITNVHKNLILNMLSNKFVEKVLKKPVEPDNILSTFSFYKTPLEASKLGRDDVCLITTFPYIFMPDTIFMQAWSILQGIIIVFICIFYPYCAAYTRRYPVETESLILLVDFTYIFDIYITLFTAVNKENILLSTGREIARERLRHMSIYLDIFASLPIYYFLPHEDRIKPVVLCIRCIKLYKIPILFGKAEYNLNQTVINVLRLIKYVLYFLIATYVMGLMYYMQACYYEICSPDSWYSQIPEMKNVQKPVFISLYFAIMVISGTGYGDITVRNLIDIIWVVNFYFPGVLLFCYIISEYSAHLSLAREPRYSKIFVKPVVEKFISVLFRLNLSTLNFIELASRVNSFLTTNKMLPSERIRVRQYLNLQWEKNMGYEFINGHDLFYDTPSHLYYEINLESRCKGIHDMIVFKGLGDNIMNTMLKNTFRRTFPPHEVVIYAGEMCSTLLIIEDGYCEVTYGRDVNAKKIIGPGESICTVELLLGLPALTHVRTLTHCVIVKIRKSDIRRALILNPEAARELEFAIYEFKQFPIMKNLQKATPVRLHLAVRPTMQDSVFRFRYYQKQSGNVELREPYMKLGICQCIRYLLRSTTVLPYGKLLKRWEVVRCLFAFCSSILFPLLPYWELEAPSLLYFGWVLDVTAWADLYFRMHVGYYNNRNILVTHPLSTCAHYIKGSFALDFLFCFPFDRIMYRRVFDSLGETTASDTSIDILRLLRVGQVHRIPATLMGLGQDFLSTPSVFLVTLMHTGFITIYITLLTSLLLLFTCNYKIKTDGSYYIVFSDNNIRDHMMSILNQFNFTAEPSQLYTLNFYWVGLTAFSIGFGDVAAATQVLMLFVISVIVMSYLYFNYVTIVLASCFSSINLNLTLYQKRLTHLIKFLRTENIEPLLKQHIINHFEFMWKKSRGMQTEVVFANFNLALKDDVMLHLYEDTLKQVKAFSQLDPSFLRLLSSRLQEAYFQSGASVYKQGDIISQIYIIHQGEVTMVGMTEDQTAILGRSRIFGHLGEGGRGISSASAVATKNLHILMIPAVELHQILGSVRGKTIEDVEQNDFQNKTIAALNRDSDEDSFGDKQDDKNLRREILGARRIWFIHTSYKFSEIIHMIYLVVAFLSVNLVSYHMAFQSYHWPIIGISIPIEIFYILKIYIGFNTGFIDDSGEFVTDLNLIRTRYLRIAGFYKDFFTLIPFEVLAFSVSDRRIFVATALRMTKLLRIYEIWFFFNAKADTLNVNMLLLKVVSISITTAIIYHQCACLWFMIMCPLAECPDSTTYNAYVEVKCHSMYLCCIYFINIVLTTTGYGDLTPYTPREMLFTLFLAYLARIYAAIFIGQMVSTVQKSLYARTTYAFETETLKGFLIANNVTPHLRRVILNYANDLWRNEKGYQIPELLMNAPKYVISEIKLAAYGHHINDNPIFANCNPIFRKHLINEFNRTIYFPGNIIVHEGEVNGTAYFIHSGQIGLKHKVHTYVVEKAFGLTQGFRRRHAHYHTYFSRSICVILTLTIDDWEYLSDFYPEDILKIYAELEKIEKKQVNADVKV